MSPPPAAPFWNGWKEKTCRAWKRSRQAKGADNGYRGIERDCAEDGDKGKRDSGGRRIERHDQEALRQDRRGIHGNEPPGLPRASVPFARGNEIHLRRDSL